MSLGIEPISQPHFPAILDLNAKYVSVLAPLDDHSLRALLAVSCFARVVHCGGCERNACGFMIVCREGQTLASENYAWFTARYPRFLYLDRVVLDTCMQGRGVGRDLYAALEVADCARNVPLLTLEYNIEPLNAASHAFHARMGFVQVGERRLPAGKRVAMMTRALQTSASDSK